MAMQKALLFIALLIDPTLSYAAKATITATISFADPVVISVDARGTGVYAPAEVQTQTSQDGTVIIE